MKPKIITFFSRRIIWGSFAALVVALGAWQYFASNANAEFQTLTIHPARFAEQVSISGTVIAAQDVDLGFAQSGRVSGVYASVGRHVAAGALLAQTDNGDLRAALAQRQAALKVQGAKLASLRAGTRPEETAVTEVSIESDKAALTQAKTAVVNAIQTVYTQSDDAVHNKVDQFFSNPRSVNPQLSLTISDSQLKVTLETQRAAVETLLGTWKSSVAALAGGSDLASAQAQAQSNIAKITTLLSNANAALNAAIPATQTQATIDGYVTSVGTARASINTASSALTTAITAQAVAQAALDHDQQTLTLQQAGSTTEDIAGQEAEVASAQADVQSAQAQLNKTIISAPFAGTITRMDAKIGQVISPTDPQISMIGDGLFQIECYIPEVEIAGLSVGDNATTTLDAYGLDAPFAARVVAIDPGETVVSGVSTYKTTLQFLRPDPRIRSGMTASVVITAHEILGAFVLPQGAVFQKDGHATVQVLRRKVVANVVVQTGAASSVGNVQIVSGLHDGDMVILNPDTSL